MLESQRPQLRARGGLVIVTPSANQEWVEALLDLGVRGMKSLVVYLDPRGFGGKESLVIAPRWRQALNWWVVQGPEDLEAVGERKVAAV